MLIHACHRWPNAITTNLWPYALHTANELSNTIPSIGSEYSPLELFSGVPICPSIKHFHPFGCFAYVLDNCLQQWFKIPKWQACTRLGIYLGPSPHHARLVGLILNNHTGHASPQFHVKYDDHFQTTPISSNITPSPTWIQTTGFGTPSSKSNTIILENFPSHTENEGVNTSTLNNEFIKKIPNNNNNIPNDNSITDDCHINMNEPANIQNTFLRCNEHSEQPTRL